MLREGIKASPETIVLVKLYDILTQVFSEKGKAPKPLLNDFLIEPENKEKPMAYSSPEEFEKAWAKINKR